MKRERGKEEGILSLMDDLPLQELYQFRKDFNTKYREMVDKLIGTFFQSGGGKDIFCQYVFNALALIIPLPELVQFRLVCSYWDRGVREVSSITCDTNTSNDNYFHNLVHIYKNLTSLRVGKGILYQNGKEGLFQNIKSLEIVDYKYDDRVVLYTPSVNLSGWGSLERLIIPTIKFYISGLSHLSKTLTHLTCDYSIFKGTNNNILLLKKLTHLSIKKCPDSIDISSELDKLVYLESDYPSHFFHFTGNGKLETSPVSDMVLATNIVIKRDFDHYWPNAFSISMKGEWLDGVFMKGMGFIRYSNDGDGIYVVGEFVDGRLDGLVVEFNDVKSSLYVGKWADGEKHGIGKKYNWSEPISFETSYRDKHKCDMITEEVWDRGILKSHVSIY